MELFISVNTNWFKVVFINLEVTIVLYFLTFYSLFISNLEGIYEFLKQFITYQNFYRK